MDNHIPNILLVDDDLELLITLGEILRVKGFEPIFAQTGAVALAQIKQQPVDVVLIDLKLGDMSGLDVLRGIKDCSPESECILLTGNASQASAIEAIQMGAFGYFQKPFDVEQVILSVQHAADKYHSTLALRASEEKYRTVADFTYDWEIWLDPQQKLIYVSPACERVSGYRPEEFIADNGLMDRIIHPDDREIWVRHLSLHGQEEKIGNVDGIIFRIIRRDGQTRWVEHVCCMVHGVGGTCLGWRASNRDITQRRQAEEALRESEQLIRESQVVAGLGSYSLDFSSGLWKCSDVLDQVFGIDETYERSVEGWAALIHPEDRARVVDYFTEEVSGLGRMFDKEYRIVRHNDQTVIWVHGLGRLEFDSGGHPMKMHGTIQDVTARKRVDEALRASEAKTHALLDAIPDLMFVLNREGVFLDYHAPKSQLLYAAPESYLGKNMRDFLPPQIAEPYTSILDQLVVGGESQFFEYALDLADGQHYFEAHIVAYQADHILIVVRDISAHKQVEEELRQAKASLEQANRELQIALIREQELAHTDVLTGVSNRRYLFELAEDRVAVALRYQQPLAVMMFDIDHFKKVNDTFGHAIGDQMLKRVTQIACAELRGTDVIGRYGGEEFIILLPMTNSEHACLLAERIRARVAALRIPTEKGDATVTLSIGIVELSHASVSVEDIFRRADNTMYTAKQAGRNRVVIADLEGA